MRYLLWNFPPLLIFAALSAPPIGNANADDWTIAGTVLTPNGVMADGAVSVSSQRITAVGLLASMPGASSAIKVPGVILPGFIDLHNHLTWNVLPRWLPGRKFANRYEWQDTAEYDRLLSAPHTAVTNSAACESEIYAEIKAIVGGATSVVGSLIDPKHPEYSECALGLARNLDVASGLPFQPPPPDDRCEKEAQKDAGTYQPLLDVVENEVFPFELTHVRMDFLLCELRAGVLRSLVIHLSEGASTDSSAHREFTMLSKEGLLTQGLIIVHGTALRDQDFIAMKDKAALVWSPRSNDELYGSTTNIAAAHEASIPVAIAPDWSPSGSAGMLQEVGYAARRYTALSSAQLVAMATAVPAAIARVDDQIGQLAPKKLADLVVINAKVDANASKPLDPVVKATPADVVLVMVGGEALYGDRAVLAQFLPPGTKLETMTVCGAEKAIYLGQSDAAKRGQSLSDIENVLDAALAKAGSKLPEIECD